MGEIEVRGRTPRAACQRLTTNDVRRLADGHAQYSLLCREDGGVVDDVTLYRLDDQRFFFCVNASNREGPRLIEEHAGGADVVDRSDATGAAGAAGTARRRRILGALTAARPRRDCSASASRAATVAGIPALVARTGYTGEDGFELYVARRARRRCGRRSSTPDAPTGLEPVGLGARDTLRLEAALPLYGHELDDETSPLEAGLGRFVKLDGDDFVGREALLHEQAHGAPRRLVGLEMRGPGIARQGYPVLHDGARGRRGDQRHAVADAWQGRSRSPMSTAALASLGTELAVEIRGRRRAGGSRAAAVLPPPATAAGAPPERHAPRSRRDGDVRGAARWRRARTFPSRPSRRHRRPSSRRAPAAPAPTMPEPSNLDDVPDHVPGEGES